MNPNPLHVDIKWPHIEFNGRIFQFHCAGCGERLQLDAILCKKLHAEGAVPVLKHIVDTQVSPWLEEHMDCGEVRAFAV